MKKILLILLLCLLPFTGYAYTVGESPVMLPPAYSVYAPQSAAADQGATSTAYVTLKNLVDSIGVGEIATIIFSHSGATDTTTYTLTTNETVPSNITVWVEPGAILDGAGTLTINGPFAPGLTQCFGASITVTFGAGAVKQIHSEWFGNSSPYTLTANDPTPSIGKGYLFKTANTIATTISDFTSGITGQEIKILINEANTKIDFSGTNLKGNNGADWSCSSGDSMVCVFDGTNWYCIISSGSTTDISFLSPLSIPPAAFVSALDTFDWDCSWTGLKNRAALTLQYFYAPVLLPHGVTVTKVTLYGYRDDALAVLKLSLGRNNRSSAVAQLLVTNLTADWISGYSSIGEDTILYDTIDNETYHYSLIAEMDPNDSVEDVKFLGATVDFVDFE